MRFFDTVGELKSVRGAVNFLSPINLRSCIAQASVTAHQSVIVTLNSGETGAAAVAENEK
jgi:hypothetical protein